MKRIFRLIFDKQGYDYPKNNLSLLRDPSLRAFAQDDSQSFGGGREKRFRAEAQLRGLRNNPGLKAGVIEILSFGFSRK